MRIVVVFLFSGFLAGCTTAAKLPKVDETRAEAERAKQYELIITDQLAMRERLFSIAHPILRDNAALCGEDVWWTFSFDVISQYAYKEKERKYALSAGIDKRPTVIAVPSGSSAHDAGVQKGDVIVALGDWRVPDEDYLDDYDEKLEAAGEGVDAVPITFLRDGAETIINVPKVTTCGYATHLVEGPANAFADGESLFFSTGIMNLLRDDNELAVVVGHELAHNTMDHIGKKQGNAAVGLIFDLLFAGVGVNTGGAFSDIGAQAYSQDFEAEADYVGLYYVYRAGFPIDHAPRVWRRMAIGNPGSVEHNVSSTHPSTPERFVALEETAKEIKAKVASGEPLVPSLEADK